MAKLELESEPKLWKVEPESELKINNFGSVKLHKTIPNLYLKI